MSPVLIWTIALAGYAAYWLTDIRRQANKLPRLLSRAKELGCPTTLEDFKSVLAVDESNNAAPVYRELIDAFSDLGRTQNSAIETVRASPTTAEPSDSAEELACDALRPLVEIARRAEHYGANRYYQLDSSSLDSGDRLAEPIRLALKVVMLDAKRQAYNGDFEGMERSVLLARKLVEHSFYEPTTLSWLVRISQEVRRLQSLGVLARICKDRSEVLKLLYLEAADSPKSPALLPCVMAEVAYSLRYSDHVRIVGLPKVFSDRPPIPLSLRFFQSDMALDAYLAVALEGILKSVLSWPDSEEDWVRVGAALQPMYSGTSWLLKPSHGWNIGSSNPASALNALEIRRTLSTIGISLIMKSRVTGELPRELPKTDPEHQALSLMPVRYQIVGDDFKLTCGNLEF